MKPHEYTLNGRVYGLRGCAAGGESHSGFVWPLTVGAEVTAPDWNPAPVCGGGLHFLPWGAGDAGLLPDKSEAVYLVVSAVDPVSIDDDKCKAQTCRVEFVGQRHEAANYLAGLGAPYAVPFVALAGGKGSTLTGGYQSTLTGGDGSTLTGGDESTLVWRIWDDARYRLHVAYVGEAGIEPNKPYKFMDGEIIAAPQEGA